jgi:hypothetical protein
MEETGEYQTFGDARDALIDLLRRYGELSSDLNHLRGRIDQMQRNADDKASTLRDISDEIKKVLPLVGMGFHMEVKDLTNG